MDGMREIAGNAFAIRARDGNTQAVSLSSRIQAQFERAASAPGRAGSSDRASACKPNAAGVDSGDRSSREAPLASRTAYDTRVDEARDPVIADPETDESERADQEGAQDGAGPAQATMSAHGPAAHGHVLGGRHLHDGCEGASEGVLRCAQRHVLSREARLAQGRDIEGAPFDVPSGDGGQLDSRRLPSGTLGVHRLAQGLGGFGEPMSDALPTWGDVPMTCGPAERQGAFVDGAASMAGAGGQTAHAMQAEVTTPSAWTPMSVPFETRLALRLRRAVVTSSEREGEPPGFQYRFSSWPGQPTVHVEFDESSRSRKTLITTDDKHVLQTLVDARGGLHDDLSIADVRSDARSDARRDPGR